MFGGGGGGGGGLSAISTMSSASDEDVLSIISKFTSFFELELELIYFT